MFPTNNYLNNKIYIPFMAKKRVKKHHHSLLVFFVITLLLFMLSFSFGSFNQTFNDKRIAAVLISDGNGDLALTYCAKMKFRNFECYDMYMDNVNEFDKNICSVMNVGKLPFWTSENQERKIFLNFKKVKEKCLSRF